MTRSRTRVVLAAVLALGLAGWWTWPTPTPLPIPPTDASPAPLADPARSSPPPADPSLRATVAERTATPSHAQRKTLFGRCVDTEGRPLDGVEVRARVVRAADQSTPGLDITTEPVRSDADGRIIVELAWPHAVSAKPTELIVSARKPGWTLWERTRPDRLQPFVDLGRIRLERAFSITGRCVDEDGNGVAGALVRVGIAPTRLDTTSSPTGMSTEFEVWGLGPVWEHGFGVARPTAVTDDDGRFEVDGVPLAITTRPDALVYARTDVTSTVRRPLPVPAGDEDSEELGEIVLRALPADALIRGEVRGLHDEVIAGATVEILRGRDRSIEVRTEVDGSFVVPAPPGRSQMLRVEHASGWKAGTRVQPGRGPIVLGPGRQDFTLRIVDRDTDEPVALPPGSTFAVSARVGMAADVGRSEFSLTLPPDAVRTVGVGTYVLTIPRTACSIATPAGTYGHSNGPNPLLGDDEKLPDFLAGEGVLRVDASNLPEVLTGRVVDPDGRPVAGATVVATAVESADWPEGVSVRRSHDGQSIVATGPSSSFGRSSPLPFGGRRGLGGGPVQTDRGGRFEVLARRPVQLHASHDSAGEGRVSLRGFAETDETTGAAIEIRTEGTTTVRGRVRHVGTGNDWSGTVRLTRTIAHRRGDAVHGWGDPVRVDTDHPEFVFYVPNTPSTPDLDRWSLSYRDDSRTPGEAAAETAVPEFSTANPDRPLSSIEIVCADGTGRLAFASHWPNAAAAIHAGYGDVEHAPPLRLDRDLSFALPPFATESSPRVLATLLDPIHRLRLQATKRLTHDGETWSSDFAPRATTVLVPEHPADATWTARGRSEDGWDWTVVGLRSGVHVALPVGTMVATGNHPESGIRRIDARLVAGETSYLITR